MMTSMLSVHFLLRKAVFSKGLGQYPLPRMLHSRIACEPVSAMKLPTIYSAYAIVYKRNY